MAVDDRLSTTAAPACSAPPVPRLRPAPGGRALADVLAPALAGGVDVVQLRDKHARATSCSPAPPSRAALCDERGALLILNDRPDLVPQAGADGCHVGQDDMDAAAARALAGDGAIVGQSTHFPDEVDAATDADYIGVGPVYATPTKPGRPAVGLDSCASRRATRTCRSSRSAASTPQRRRRRRRRRAADRRRARDHRGRRPGRRSRRPARRGRAGSPSWAPVAASAAPGRMPAPRAGGPAARRPAGARRRRSVRVARQPPRTRRRCAAATPAAARATRRIRARLEPLEPGERPRA